MLKKVRHLKLYIRSHAQNKCDSYIACENLALMPETPELKTMLVSAAERAYSVTCLDLHAIVMLIDMMNAERQLCGYKTSPKTNDALNN